jgi:hypothetical protein
MDQDVLHWLREAAKNGTSWTDVRAALQSHDPDGEDIRLRPFVFAFGYAFLPRSSSRRERVGEPYGAMIAGDGWRFPPRLADIEDVDIEAWQAALDAVDHQVVKARLGDLLWERRARPRPDLAAREACDGLMQLATDERWSVMDRTRMLSRALELARELRALELQQGVVAAMLRHAEADLASEHGGPGASLGSLQPLVELPASERPEELDGLLRRVGDRYGADPFIDEKVNEFRARLLGPDERRELQRQQIRRWREEAAQGDAILRLNRLQHALDLARTHGLTEEAEDLRRDLGRIAPDDLGLARISADLEFPAEEVERFLAHFGQAPTWQVALQGLAAQPAPGGRPADLEQQVDELMESFPLQYLMTKEVIGPDNATAIFRAAAPDDHRRLALAEQRAHAARVWSAFGAEALDRVGRREDRPDRDALSAFFAGEMVDGEVAERLARGVELFWDGQYDESAHVLVPRLEAVVREMARQVGVPIVNEPRPGREIGGVELLGGLLRDLEGAFADEAWHAYLTNLLVDSLGLNLRNSIAHGLHGVVGRLDAALLVQAAVALGRMGFRQIDDVPGPPPGAGPS